MGAAIFLKAWGRCYYRLPRTQCPRSIFRQCPVGYCRGANCRRGSKGFEEDGRKHVVKRGLGVVTGSRDMRELTPGRF
jgi:hypothetical protein